jgi:hypothetical protein
MAGHFGRLAALLALLALTWAASAAAPVTTTVAGTARNAAGKLATGTLTITPSNAFTAGDGTEVELAALKITLVNGAFAVGLVPTDTSTPAATYTVRWQITGATERTETWAVPTTTNVLAPKDVAVTPAAGALTMTLQGTLAGMPSVCAAGQTYFATDAAAGANLYGCTAGNVWTLEGGIESIYNGATLVGATSAVEFVSGFGVTLAISQAGSKIEVEPAVDTSVMETIAAVQSGNALLCATESASATTYTCSMSPVLTAYTPGMVINFVSDVSGAGGATTLNIDTLGSHSLKQADCATNPTSSDIVAGVMRQVRFSGLVWCFMGPTNAAVSGVSSVFGRTGAVAAASGDYTAAQVTYAAATNASNTFTAGTQDFSGASHTRPVIVAATTGALPGTCAAGELAFVSGATAGQQIYECSAANTWTQQVAGSGGGGGSAPAPVFGTYASRGTCMSANVGQLFHASDVSNKHWECDGATWQPVAFDMQVVEPTALTWTPVVGAGTDTPTIANVAGAVQLSGVRASTNTNVYNFLGMLTPISISTPYTIEIAFTVDADLGGYASCAWGVANGNAATSAFFGPVWNNGYGGSASLTICASLFNNFCAGYTGAPAAPRVFAEPVIRSEMVDDGVNRNWYLNTGSGWQLQYSASDTFQIASPTYFGIGCLTGSLGDRFQLTLYHASVHH